MARDEPGREQWGTQWGFILATIGSAVGLGNIWRFPTVVAENGGGTFLFVYLIVVFLIGIPMMIAEITLGRAGRQNVIGTLRRLSPRGDGWRIIGVLPIAASFIILSFYFVVAGWTLIYILSSLSGLLSGMGTEDLSRFFTVVTGNPVLPLVAQAVFISFTVIIVVLGIKKGIERWGRILMPGIIILLVILLIRTSLFEGFWSGVVWFLRPDLAALSFSTALEAVGQVFFSFSLGMGAILTYGSYLPRRSNIPANSLYISLADLGVAILTGLIVIPALFVFGLSPETGPGLIFITLPALFNTITLGMLWSTIFFLLLAFAAITSTISLLEVLVAYLVEETGLTRFFAAVLSGMGVFIVGIPAALSFGVLENIRIGGATVFDFLDFNASNILLPLGGLLVIVFIGWIWGTGNAVNELEKEGTFKYSRVWSLLVRFLVPLAIAYIFISAFIS